MKMKAFVCGKCGSLIKAEVKYHDCKGELVEERKLTGDLVQDADFMIMGGKRGTAESYR